MSYIETLDTKVTIMFNSIVNQNIEQGIDGFYCALERITGELSSNCNIIAYLECSEGQEIARIQRDVFAKAFIAFSQKQWQQKLQAAGVFQRVTQALHEMKPMSDAPYYYRDYLAVAKYFVQAFVEDGWIEYVPAVEYKDSTVPANYILNYDAVELTIGMLLHLQPKVQMQFIKEGTKHYDGAMAMSAKRFTVNKERLMACYENLKNKYLMTRDGDWKQIEGDSELAKYKQQVMQFKELRYVARTSPDGFHFEVKSDFRGRLYYVAGLISPQNGGIPFYCLTTDESVTYDSTASFAQFISVLTADAGLAQACGLLNFTDTPSDFYAEAYALASGKEKPAKDSFIRDVAKKYLMPKAYGASDETCTERARTMAIEKGYNIDEAVSVIDALKGYSGLNTTKEAAGQAAKAAAENDLQLQWVTPSGFTVKQNYWEQIAYEWTTRSPAMCIPTQITFMERTGKVCTDSNEKNFKSAVVAAAANIIQSLDAAFMAEVTRRLQERGITIICIHDSFTFDNQKDADGFKELAWEVFIEQAISQENKAIRRMLHLPERRLSFLSRKAPCFIAQE